MNYINQNPIDIICPDALIQVWLDEWNKHNLDPITLEQLDDITFDFVYRAMDYAANMELNKTLQVVESLQDEPESLIKKIKEKRRPQEEETLKGQVLNELTEIQHLLDEKLSSVKKKINLMKVYQGYTVSPEKS